MPSLLHVLAAVDGDIGAIDEGSLFGTQVNNQTGDLLGLAKPAYRDLRNNLGVENLVPI
jgi:hypothetical protein